MTFILFLEALEQKELCHLALPCGQSGSSVSLEFSMSLSDLILLDLKQFAISWP